MSKAHIEDLSAIMEKKGCEESQMTFEESKPLPNIRCLINNRQNYQCMICNRLRQVCPYSKLPPCQHQRREKGVYRSDYFLEKSNITTLPGERMRTLSNYDALKYTEQSRSRQERQVQNISRTYEVRPIPQQLTQTHINLTPQEEIIYYPVIHNRLVLSPSVDKSPTTVHGTPNRIKRSRRVEYSEEVILTPTQIKEMLYSYKQ